MCAHICCETSMCDIFIRQMSPVSIFHTALTIILMYHSVAAKTWTSVAIQIGDTMITPDAEISTSSFKYFYNCLCGKALYKPNCFAPFNKFRLDVKFNNFLKEISYPLNKRCGVWNDKKTLITLNYASPYPKCSVSPDRTFIHVESVPNGCSSACVAIVTNILPYQQQISNVDSVNGNSASCNSSCCSKVFEKFNEKISPTDQLITTTVSTSRSTATEEVIKQSTTSASTKTASSTRPEFYNGTWSVKTDIADHHHHESRDSMVLVISIITVLLAVTAIVISSIVCWRYRLHTKLKLSADLELRRYTEGGSTVAGVEQQTGNIYSDLRRGNGGSIHNYTGLSHYLSHYDTVIYNEVGASNCLGEHTGHYSEINDNNQVDIVNPVYDDVNYNDIGYLQIKDQ